MDNKLVGAIETAGKVIEDKGAVIQSQLHYRSKCNFDKSRSGRLNKNHLQAARCIKAVIMIANLGINMWCIYNNASMAPDHMAWNVFAVTISYYSVWGSTIALIAHVTSIIACNKEGWFKTAYMANEISFAVNSVIMIIFWCLLWPLMSHLGMLDNAWTKWYQGLLHFIPWCTTVAELAMTDLALEKTHWKWMAFVMCPCYMSANAWGALNFEPLV